MSSSGDLPAPASDEAPERRPYNWIPLLVTTTVAALILAVGASLLLWQQRPPSTDSAEAGFARDMQVHHAQAVEMSLIVREKSDDPALRSVAYDVATSQQQQLGQMSAWLQLWGLPAVGRQPQMAWMSDSAPETGDGAMDMPGGGQMPGMASPEQVAQLRRARGVEAEVLYLRLMIKHHTAGAAMAKAMLGRTDVPVVRSLASAMVRSQTAEITVMKDLLTTRGAGPELPRKNG